MYSLAYTEMGEGKIPCSPLPSTKKKVISIPFLPRINLRFCLYSSDVNECASNNGGCEQICTDNVGSFECSCRPGFTRNGRFCDDVDECATGTHDCEQTCINIEGSFTCSCGDGLVLSSDGRSCDG